MVDVNEQRRTDAAIEAIDADDSDCDEPSARTQTLGLLVDAVQEVFACQASELEAVPRLGTRVAPGFLRSMVRSQGQATPELDLDAALDIEQLSQLVGGSAEKH